MNKLPKDPDSVLDYEWDFSLWLEEDTIKEHSFIVSSTELVVDSSSELDGVVTAWISGGLENKAYAVTCRIVTNLGRTKDFSGIFMIVEE